MKSQVDIAARPVGGNNPCFIIAEAGVNHNGSVEMAKQLIDAAAEAGADAVKFQTFRAEKLVTRSASQAKYQSENTGKKESQFDMLKRLELPYEVFPELKAHADRKGIFLFSTPHSGEDAVELLVGIGVPAMKVGSGDLTNTPLLRFIAETGLPIILSIGMAYMDEIREAVSAIESEGNSNIILLHCTTNYPTAIEEVNLKAMKTIEREFGRVTGYSDHTEGIDISVAAAAMGAKVIEKHFTLDRKLPGPDHKASLEPDELKEMVQKIRIIEKALGTGIKRPFPSELEVAKIARKSVVAAEDILKGTVIKKDMLGIKRPETGIRPGRIGEVIGSVAMQDISADETITFDMIKR